MENETSAYTPNQDRTISISSKFELNFTKAMVKKLRPCKRVQTMSIKDTSGGLRIYCQGGFFEILKQTMLLISKTDILGCVNQRSQEDAKGKSFAKSFFVKDEFANVSYTLNMYLADSTKLINGKSVNVFLSRHLPIIMEMI